jgi:membrane fusion protein, multidrug efflux system
MTATRLARRTLFAGTIAALTVLAAAWLAYSYRQSDAAASAAPAAPPQVVVSRPLVREVDSRLGFLGQFSAVEQVELRAQVGGTLTESISKTAILSTRMISSSPSIRVPTRSGWRKRTRNLKQRQRASTSPSELVRAQALQRSMAGTAQNVDRRTADQRAAQAAVGDAKAQIRDAQFDLEHCRIQVIIDGIPHAAPGTKVAPQDGTIRDAAGEGQG